MNRWRWLISRLRYLRHGIWLSGHPEDLIWLCAWGWNVRDRAGRERWGWRGRDWRPGNMSG